jgi:hypothetical protein
MFSTTILGSFLFSSAFVSQAPANSAKFNDFVLQGWESQSDCAAVNGQPSFALVIPASNISTTIGSPLQINWSCKNGIFQGPLYYPATGVGLTNQPLNFGLLATKQCEVQKAYNPTNGTQIAGMFQTSQCGPQYPMPSPATTPTPPRNSLSAALASSSVVIIIGITSGILFFIIAGAIVYYCFWKKAARNPKPRKSLSEKKQGEDFTYGEAVHDEEKAHRASLNPLHRISLEQRNSVLGLSGKHQPLPPLDGNTIEVVSLPARATSQRLSFGMAPPTSMITREL